MSEGQEFDPAIGRAEALEGRVRRIVAPNPSPMTFRGTNTYLVGTSDIAVIDPGPDDARHLEAILDAIGPRQRITHVLVSHAHRDHSPLARALSQETGAAVLGFGPAEAGRSAVMQSLAATGAGGGGEGIDAQFRPDVILEDGQEIVGSDWRLRALHTPGHIGNHLCFALDDICFTADHVMGWSTSLVSPPDGDLTDFMASCAKLSADRWRIFFPGHGAPVTAPNQRLEDLIAHRKKREIQILEALDAGPASARELAHRVYVDVAPALLPAAARNVLAHLIDLTQRNEVVHAGDLAEHAVFARRSAE